MAQRWSFEEDYIVCKFSYGHMIHITSERELSNLATKVESITVNKIVREIS